MSNEKDPIVPKGGDRPAIVDETAPKNVDPVQEIATPVPSEKVRPTNGAGRRKTVVHKIKNYLN